MTKIVKDTIRLLKNCSNEKGIEESLLIMIKDISLNHSSFSKHIFDMEFKYLQKNLKKSFRKNHA